MGERILIFGAYAYDLTLQSGANVARHADKEALYLKNALVALASAKRQNAQCTVALVTNAELPARFAQAFKKHEIKLILQPFDSFRFDSQYKWGLAFYKLCALSKVLELDFDKYLLIDLDTYTQSPMPDLWEETEHYILLYDVNHRLSNLECQRFQKEAYDFCGIERAVTNYGSEFIAGNKQLLTQFVDHCADIYNRMIRKGFRTTVGDEFVVRLAAAQMPERIKNAGGYIFRYWTGAFYLVSTCYRFNAVSVLHLPDEKGRGILKLYAYLTKHGCFPAKARSWRMLRLRSPSFRTRVKWMIKGCGQ